MPIHRMPLRKRRSSGFARLDRFEHCRRPLFIALIPFSATTVDAVSSQPATPWVRRAYRWGTPVRLPLASIGLAIDDAIDWDTSKFRDGSQDRSGPPLGMLGNLKLPPELVQYS